MYNSIFFTNITKVFLVKKKHNTYVYTFLNLSLIINDYKGSGELFTIA